MENQNDLISREALKKATKSFIDSDGFNPVWQIIDNAPAVKTDDDKYLEKRDADAYESGYLQGHIDGYLKAEKDYAKPQGDCENCDFRKFSETFIDGVVDVMNKNGITSVEQLQEILKGGAE